MVWARIWESFQVAQQLAGGDEYIHNSRSSKVISPTWLMNRETEFDDLDEIYSVMGRKPIAMLLNEASNNDMNDCGLFR